MKKAKVIVVLGTNASGKTKLAIKLARKFKGEIISADSRQVYKGMDIGTGKDLKEYAKVPYHLVDIVSPRKDFSVAQWQKLAYEAINDILEREKVPIVVGGTGLYISALIEGYVLLQSQISNLHRYSGIPLSKKNNKERDKFQRLRRQLDKLSLKQLLSSLKRIDSKTYQAIDQKNRRRVQRALEIYYQTGIAKSAQLKKKKPVYDFLLLGVTFPREELKKRIEKRLKQRLEKQGMIEEVKKLRQHGLTWKRLDEFGLEYRYIAQHLQGKITYDQMFDQLKKAIANFAKRQMTWFSRYESGSRSASGKRDQKIRWIKNYQEAEKLVKKFVK